MTLDEPKSIKISAIVKKIFISEKLFAQKAISQQELTCLQLDYHIRKEALTAAERDLDIIRQNTL